MRTIDLILKNDYAVTVAGTANTTVSITIPVEEKIHAFDLGIDIDSVDNFSKDIIVYIRNQNDQDEQIAFWDDSTATIFKLFYQLINHEIKSIRIYFLNNHATNDLNVKYISIRFYLYD